MTLPQEDLVGGMFMCCRCELCECVCLFLTSNLPSYRRNCVYVFLTNILASGGWSCSLCMSVCLFLTSDIASWWFCRQELFSFVYQLVSGDLHPGLAGTVNGCDRE